jgi:CRISPR system Cascade subunit CasE
MPDEALHLIKVPLRADKLAAIAKRRNIRLRDLDDGYLVHCLLTELWQARAPSPFVIRGSGGRTLDVWGYSVASAGELTDHAHAFGDPSILAAFDELNGVSSRKMPRFDKGRRVGFLIRVCPVARVARATARLRQGAEVDVFLSRCFAADPGTTLSREAVYREWFSERMSNTVSTGVSLARVSVASMARTRLVRRTQGGTREAKSLDRPDVRLEGELVVEDGDAFLRFLGCGVGRHRAFGFGALIVVPPGTSHPRD